MPELTFVVTKLKFAQSGEIFKTSKLLRKQNPIFYTFSIFYLDNPVAAIIISIAIPSF